MGACFASNYANVFLGLWENRFVFSDSYPYLKNIVWWERFIDDVILIWSGSEIDLLAFHSYLNITNIHLKLSLDFLFTHIFWILKYLRTIKENCTQLFLEKNGQEYYSKSRPFSSLMVD